MTVGVLRVEMYHASKFGNGAMVAEELRRVLEAGGNQTGVHHVRDANPRELLPADLYVFGSPTRFGKPLGKMRRFVKKVSLPSGTKYAVFATHSEPMPNKRTGKVPTEDEMVRWRQTIPLLESILKEKGLVKVADKMFFVVGATLKGPLKEGWQTSVEKFTSAILGPS